MWSWVLWWCVLTGIEDANAIEGWCIEGVQDGDAFIGSVEASGEQVDRGGGCVRGTGQHRRGWGVVYRRGAAKLKETRPRSVVFRRKIVVAGVLMAQEYRGTFSGSVTFSGGGGASRAVTGSGTEPTPVAPAGFTAITASATRIDLAWQDTSGNETEFRIERRSGSGVFVRIATTGPNVTTYADSGLASATVYAYRVQACNAQSCSAYTSEATATTPALPPVALSVTVRGSAPGSITSDPAGISCASSCVASVAAGTAVTLVATPGPRARFKSWGGACSGTAPACTVTLNDARSVTATFSMIFTDATTADLLPPATPIRAAHFTELLAAINAVEPGTSLSWPSPAPAIGGFVRAVHITTLRQAVGLGPVTPGGVIAAQHLNEVRLRIRALE